MLRLSLKARLTALEEKIRPREILSQWWTVEIVDTSGDRGRNYARFNGESYVRGAGESEPAFLDRIQSITMPLMSQKIILVSARTIVRNAPESTSPL
jgi:hypothetical protein